MPPQKPADTRERILDAAERLFAREGVAATSLRTLTRAADANLAAVHYHFGSKEALLDAVVERRATPVNAARLAALDQLDARGRNDVRTILRAFLAPVVETRRDGERGPLLAQLLSRIQAEPPEQVERLFRLHFGEVSREFVDALARALPHLSPATVADRFRFSVGAVVHVFSGAFALDTIPGHPARATSTHAELYDHLLSFLSAGLEAPAPEADRADDVVAAQESSR